MKKQIPLKYVPSVGRHINHATGEALAMARRYNRIVEFKFNDMRMRVRPRDSQQHVLRQRGERLAASIRRYNASPEARAYTERRAAEIQRKQQDINAAMAVLPEIVGNRDKLMSWLKVFVRNADDVGVSFSKEQLRAHLQRAGYTAGYGVGESPDWFTDWFNNRPRLAGYIIGQVLACLDAGRTPHPVAETFVDRYFELQDDEIE